MITLQSFITKEDWKFPAALQLLAWYHYNLPNNTYFLNLLETSSFHSFSSIACQLVVAIISKHSKLWTHQKCCRKQCVKAWSAGICTSAILIQHCSIPAWYSTATSDNTYAKGRITLNQIDIYCISRYSCLTENYFRRSLLEVQGEVSQSQNKEWCIS